MHRVLMSPRRLFACFVFCCWPLIFHLAGIEMKEWNKNVKDKKRTKQKKKTLFAFHFPFCVSFCPICLRLFCHFNFAFCTLALVSIRCEPFRWRTVFFLSFTFAFRFGYKFHVQLLTYQTTKFRVHFRFQFVYFFRHVSNVITAAIYDNENPYEKKEK